MKNNILRALLFAALATALLVLPAAADTLLTLENRQEGNLPGAQTGSSTVEVWLGDKRVSRRDDKTTMIFTQNPDRLVVIDHQAKTFSPIDLPVNLANLVPEDMQAMLPMFKMEVEVTETDETRTIGDWQTKRWNLTLSNATGMVVNAVLWMTTDLDFDYETFRQLSMRMAELQPGGEGMAEKLQSIPGFPVLTETAIDLRGTTFKTFEELQKVEEKDAPSGTYEAPKGYTEKAFDAIANAAGG
ncbi:MAG: DUF4412 domain-containing protein [Acidobacteriota bacterium]